MAVSFIGWENWSTQRKSQVYKFYHKVSNTHHHVRESNWQLLVVISIVCIGRCKSNWQLLVVIDTDCIGRCQSNWQLLVVIDTDCIGRCQSNWQLLVVIDTDCIGRCQSNWQLLVVIDIDCIGRCKSYHHKIMAHVSPLYKIHSDFFHKWPMYFTLDMMT
jgi:predicted lipoprotein with Yx(FWY)xxD motif